jgi:hypothetical protein
MPCLQDVCPDGFRGLLEHSRAQDTPTNLKKPKATASTVAFFHCSGNCLSPVLSVFSFRELPVINLVVGQCCGVGVASRAHDKVRLS